MTASDTARTGASAQSSRIELLDLAHLTEAQQQIAKEVAAGPRGAVRGPVRAWLHSPELANHAQKLGEFLRWGTVLEPRISELIILVTARYYSCHYIWFNHVQLALKGGISEHAVERIKNRQEPTFQRADEKAVYAFAAEVLRHNTVSDATLAQVRRLFGDRGVVEMGAIIGHYHSGAIVLDLVDIDLPDGTNNINNINAFHGLPP